MKLKTAIAFVKAELRDRDLPSPDSNDHIRSLYVNCVEAGEILTKKEISKMIDDYLDLYGIGYYL